MFKVRIRGVFATALTKLALDWGYKVVQASDQIASRFGIEQVGEPPDLTVKDSGTPDSIVAIGKPDAVEDFCKRFLDLVKFAVIRKSLVNLHSVWKLKVKRVTEDGKAYVEFPNGIEALVRDGSGLKEGDIVLVHVVKPPLTKYDEAVVAQGICVYGDYAAVIPGGKILISEHIRDSNKRAELMALALSILGMERKWGIKWRSSAKFADENKLVDEINKLFEKLREVEEKARFAEPGTMLLDGEKVVEITLPLNAKEVLDDVRSRVVPTVRYHHSIKCNGREASQIVDFAEKVVAKKPEVRDCVSEALIEFLIDKLREGGSVRITHIKPDGEILSLTPGRVEKIEGKKLVLRRVFRGGGVYDALGVPKEEGDYDLMEVEFGAWRVVHRYYSRSGRLKGIYININTPVELGWGSIRYIDLYVDVVYVNGEKKVVDKEQLEEAFKDGLLTEELYRKALEEAEKALKEIEDYAKAAQQGS